MLTILEWSSWLLGRGLAASLVMVIAWTLWQSPPTTWVSKDEMTLTPEMVESLTPGSQFLSRTSKHLRPIID